MNWNFYKRFRDWIGKDDIADKKCSLPLEELEKRPHCRESYPILGNVLRHRGLYKRDNRRVLKFTLVVPSNKEPKDIDKKLVEVAKKYRMQAYFYEYKWEEYKNWHWEFDRRSLGIALSMLRYSPENDEINLEVWLEYKHGGELLLDLLGIFSVGAEVSLDQALYFWEMSRKHLKPPRMSGSTEFAGTVERYGKEYLVFENTFNDDRSPDERDLEYIASKYSLGLNISRNRELMDAIDDREYCLKNPSNKVIAEGNHARFFVKKDFPWARELAAYLADATPVMSCGGGCP